MGSVYARGNILWIKYKDEWGKWAWESTKLRVGEEENAREILSDIEARAAASNEFGEEADISGPITVTEFARQHWIKERESLGIADWKNDESRLRNHALPHIGNMLLAQVEARHVVRMVTAIRKTDLAPKTVRTIYSLTKALFRDAQILGLVKVNPCILTKHQLGPVVDKDSEWRATAIYSRAELEMLIVDPRVAIDHQVFYGLQGIGGLRNGEAAGLRWRHYKPEMKPLGQLVIATSYDKGRTKTGQTRLLPVHPTLAALLAEWKLHGWPEMMGRQPTPDDLMVPLPAGPRVALGTMRTKCHSYKRLRTDLKTLGLRHRRGHDLRRTMISLTMEDGARKDLLKLVTHGPPQREGIDAYVTIGWGALCAEVAKLKVCRKPRGELVELPVAAVGGGGEGNSANDSVRPSDSRVTVENNSPISKNKISGGAGNRTNWRHFSKPFGNATLAIKSLISRYKLSPSDSLQFPLVP